MWSQAKLLYIFIIAILVALVDLSASQAQHAKLREIDNKLIEAAQKGEIGNIRALIKNSANVNMAIELTHQTIIDFSKWLLS